MKPPLVLKSGKSKDQVPSSGDGVVPAFDCVGIGVCAVDHVSLLARYPRADEKTEALAYVIQGGGPVPTALATAARFGARCAFVGKVACDEEGDFVLSQLAQHRVDTSMVVRAKRGFTPRAMILVDGRTGQRTVVLNRPANFALTPREVSRAYVLQGRILHLDGRESNVALAAARWARHAGRTVVCDLGSVRANTEALLPFVDYAVVSRTFVHQFLGGRNLANAARSLLRFGPRVAVVTAGEHGCWCATHDEIIHQPAFEVKVVDTTGAGDVFHGAFLFGVLQGWELPRLLRWASATAALSCTRLGAQAALPSFAQVRRFLAARHGQ
ncbi:MAG: PfkB family carbohydrate kinase [candidate division KSB1 bacterium]|nr:PfkB family carbohydrate kinase [candidate division KSB1 bacterium]